MITCCSSLAQNYIFLTCCVLMWYLTDFHSSHLFTLFPWGCPQNRKLERIHSQTQPQQNFRDWMFWSESTRLTKFRFWRLLNLHLLFTLLVCKALVSWSLSHRSGSYWGQLLCTDSFIPQRSPRFKHKISVWEWLLPPVRNIGTSRAHAGHCTVLWLKRWDVQSLPAFFLYLLSQSTYTQSIYTLMGSCIYCFSFTALYSFFSHKWL